VGHGDGAIHVTLPTPGTSPTAVSIPLSGLFGAFLAVDARHGVSAWVEGVADVGGGSL
jgi:hypothetical protein